MENITTILGRTKVKRENKTDKKSTDSFINLMVIIVSLHIVAITALFYLGMKIAMN